MKKVARWDPDGKGYSQKTDSFINLGAEKRCGSHDEQMLLLLSFQ